MSETKDIIIERLNASYIRLHISDKGIVEDVYTYFSYKEPNFQKNKWSKWDGTQRLYKKREKTLPYGLLKMFVDFCKDRRYTFELDPRFKEDITTIDLPALQDWISTLDISDAKGNCMSPYDYQERLVLEAIKYGRITGLAATSAGKSLAIYLMTRYYEMLNQQDGLKTLILVPSINLVSQMTKDFADYSTRNKWSAAQNVHCIAEGNIHYTNKPVIVSTWQALKDEDPSWFLQIGRVIVDECHLASADSIKHILNSSVNAYQRLGVTGTLRKEKIHPLVVQSVIGPIRQIVSAKELIDAGRATATQVHFVNLEYDQQDRVLAEGLDYNGEMEYIMSHPRRNELIMRMVKHLKGNTLVLFDRVEKHLDIFYEALMNDPSRNRMVFRIAGDVDNATRDRIKAATERGDDVILLASFGTMSTGVSIKKLHNLVFVFPVKSFIRVVQSLGRMLRLHESKSVANIYDVVDSLSLPGNKPNFAKTHAMERYGIYNEEGHPIKVSNVALKPFHDADEYMAAGLTQYMKP